MNKFLSLTMVVIMLLGMIPTVFADEITDALDDSAEIDTTDAVEVTESVINTESDNGEEEPVLPMWMPLRRRVTGGQFYIGSN